MAAVGPRRTEASRAVNPGPGSHDLGAETSDAVERSMAHSNHCFLTCIQISQEAGKVFWYSHVLRSFPQFVVIRTVKCLCS